MEHNSQLSTWRVWLVWLLNWKSDLLKYLFKWTQWLSKIIVFIKSLLKLFQKKFCCLYEACKKNNRTFEIIRERSVLVTCGCSLRAIETKVESSQLTDKKSPRPTKYQSENNCLCFGINRVVYLELLLNTVKAFLNGYEKKNRKKKIRAIVRLSIFPSYFPDLGSSDFFLFQKLNWFVHNDDAPAHSVFSVR